MTNESFDTDVIETIELRRSGLSPAEEAIAAVILRDPQAASERSIGQLAQLSGSSEATVTRFCRTLGLPGYPHLRLRLAAASERRRSGEPVDAGLALLGELGREDPLAEILRKIARSETRAVEMTLQHLSEVDLKAAVDALAKARRVLTLGVAASATAAFDAAQKLVLNGIAASAAHDPHFSLMTVTTYGPSDVVLAFSHTGKTRDVVDVLALARERGVTTILVTSDAAAPAVRHASHVLQTAARELGFRSGGIASRTAQLAVIDAIFVLLAHRRFDASVEDADAMHEAVASRLLGPDRGRSL